MRKHIYMMHLIKPFTTFPRLYDLGPSQRLLPQADLQRSSHRYHLVRAANYRPRPILSADVCWVPPAAVLRLRLDPGALRALDSSFFVKARNIEHLTTPAQFRRHCARARRDALRWDGVDRVAARDSVVQNN